MLLAKVRQVPLSYAEFCKSVEQVTTVLQSTILLSYNAADWLVWNENSWAADWRILKEDSWPWAAVP